MSDVIIVNCQGKYNNTGEEIFHADGSSTESTLAATQAAKRNLTIICASKGGLDEASVVCSIREPFMSELQSTEEGIGDGNARFNLGGVDVILPRAIADSIKQRDMVTFRDEIVSLDRLLLEAITSPLPDTSFLDNGIEDFLPDNFANAFELSGIRWTKKRRIRSVPTGTTRIVWQGIHSRVERKYHELYLYCEPLDSNNNPLLFNAAQSKTVELFLECVLGLTAILFLGIETGVYEPSSFATVLGVCGLLVGIDDRGLFVVKGVWR